MRVKEKANGRQIFIVAGIPIALLVIIPIMNPGEYLQHLFVLTMMYAVVASNWDLSLGYAGIFNFAHVVFFTLGAYSTAILSTKAGFPPWLCIPASALTAVLAAVIVSLPVLRVKGIYVCLVTFAFGQLCRHLILSQSEYSGGSAGIVEIPALSLGSFSFNQNGKIAYYYLILLALIASTYFLKRIVSSNFGLSIIALRDFEELAVSRGVSVSRQRILTMAASAVFTGVTGSIYASYLSAVSPELFGFSYLTIILAIVLVGGSSTIYGSIIAAFLMIFISEYLVSLGPWRFVIIALLIILTMLIFPKGLYPSLKYWFEKLKGLSTEE